MTTPALKLRQSTGAHRRSPAPFVKKLMILKKIKKKLTLVIVNFYAYLPESKYLLRININI